MSENVQRIKVTQKFNTQPIYVNPEPDTIKIVGEGGGDMSKSVYDTNDNGIVDNAEALMGHSYDEIKKMIDDAYYQRYATVNYRDTTIHANNSLKRNLVDENAKIEVLGQTIQNCVDSGEISITANGTIRYLNIAIGKGIIKPSTQYTICCEIMENTLTSGGSEIVFRCVESNAESCFTQSSQIFNILNKSGIIKELLSSVSDISLAKYILWGLLDATATSGTLKVRYMILEGDWTNKEVNWVPFGLNYPETTEVVECGKNLFDGQLEYGFINYETGTNQEYAGYIRTTNYILVKENEAYAIGVNGNGKTSNIFYYDKNKNYLGKEQESKISFTTPIGCYYVRFMWGTYSITLTDLLQLEYGSTVTEYEPYTERKVNINYPLASVSDTIRDRYYVKDGKKYHEQVVKEIIFDGSDDETWAFDSDNNYYYIRVSDLKYYSKLLCDKAYYIDSHPDKFGQCYATTVIVLGCDRSVYPTPQDFKNYLKTNPYTFLYELSTPITTEIETDDLQSFDGQTNITTTNTVKPTLDIDIPSDLTAVVSNLMVENTSLKQENQTLTSELENQASSIESQKANMDYISMMTGVDL